MTPRVTHSMGHTWVGPTSKCVLWRGAPAPLNDVTPPGMLHSDTQALYERASYVFCKCSSSTRIKETQI